MVDVIARRQVIQVADVALRPISIPDSMHLASLRRPQDADSRWGTSEQISGYGFGRNNYAPKGFWESEDGVAEVSRRINAFVDSQGRVPTSHEIGSIGLSYFYKTQTRQGKALKDIMALAGHSQTPRRWGTYSSEEIALFGMPGHQVPIGFWRHENGREEAQRRIDGFIAQTGHAPTNTDMRNMGLNGFYNANNLGRGNWLERMMELTGNENARAAWNTPSVIALYGVDIRAPRRFWKTDEGMSEFRRRTDLFIRMNGVLPGVLQLEPLGLSGAYVSWHLDGRRGYDMMLKELGYDDYLLGRKGRRAASGNEHPSKQTYGLLTRAPAGFWVTKSGWEEALRRLMAFNEGNKRLPNENEFVMKLGLNGFYDQNVARSVEYETGLRRIFIQAQELVRYQLISPALRP